MTFKLDMNGRVALVTGGTQGIGKGIAEGLLGAGAQVVVCSRNAPAAPPQAGDRTASFFSADVRDIDQIDALMEKIRAEHGRLDLLVNNAGGSPFVEAAKASPRFSAAIIALNLTAPLNLSQRANTLMQDQDDGGAIINIASVSGTRPSPGTAAYGAAKAGLLNLTRTLGVEWAPKVRVNAVTAGLLRTEKAHLHYGNEAGIEAVARTVPLGRLGTAADVANACLFLASPLASYISGACLELHGGGEWPSFLKAAQEAAAQEAAGH